MNYALREQNNIVIGPDGGLLGALAATVETNESFNSFIDIGAGTGELSVYALNNSNCRYVHINDYSSSLKKHLGSYVGKLAQKKKAIFRLQIKNALEFNFPASRKIDAISVGIFYGAQPSFIKKYGLEFKRVLSPNGILFIQSGQLEGLFNLSLLHSCFPEAVETKKWPWYKVEYSLNYWFGNNVKSLIINGEIVTFASLSSTALKSVVKTARKNGATNLKSYEKYKFK